MELCYTRNAEKSVNRLNRIRRKWSQTTEGKTMDPVKRGPDELETIFNATLYSISLRVGEIEQISGSKTTKVRRRVHIQSLEIKKEVQLCAEIGHFLLDQLES